MRTKIVLLPLCAIVLAACGSGTDMTKDEIARASKTQAPTREQMAKMGQAMASEGNKQKSAEQEWIKQHPDKVAAVNAARAQRGLPPLGQ